MDDYLSKPVKSEVLRLKLERWTRPAESGKQLTEGNEPAYHLRDKVSGPPAELPRQGPSIDQAQFDSLKEIQQPAFMTELIDLFLDEAAAHLKDLHKALTRKDAVEIQRVAHRLKGSSANIGATQMAALSDELENNAVANDARDLLAGLESEFALVREVLKIESNKMDEPVFVGDPLSAMLVIDTPN